MRRSKTLMVLCAVLIGIPIVASAGVEADVYQSVLAVNAQLQASGSDYRVGMVEYLTARDEAGSTVYFWNVGNKQLAFDFVPGDPRRTWSGAGAGDDITWASDMVQGDAGVGTAATQIAISNAMSTWQGVNCSSLPLTQIPAAGDVGFLEWLYFGGGSPVPAADVVHAGFGTNVDLALPPPLIAATYTFVFVSGGNPTDIDNNGKGDVAMREIYYTNNFLWAVNGGHIDVETVVLHETGHALSQAHFGKAFRTNANEMLHFAPRAVMNAGYSGIQRSIGKTDLAGHCSNWASWPSN